MKRVFIQLIRFLPDKMYLSLKFYKYFKRRLNWNNPQTFCEKLQWLKLYDHQPKYTLLVDKFAVKKYVADTIGKEYVIPTLGVWNKPEDIEWDKLPNQFVLKTTHGGGSKGVCVCFDKASFNREKCIDVLNKSLKTDLYLIWREWPYKNVPKRIIAEALIEPNPGTNDLPDYKWYCFNGEPMYCQVIQNRATKETIDFFDTKWIHQEFIGLNPAASNALIQPKRPSDLDTQISLVKKLSKNLIFSRIDLYSTETQVYFGEITLYPNSGVGQFRPQIWDYKLGELLILPQQ